MLGKLVKVTVDRPLGSYHPKHKDMYYPINYGYIEGIIAGDGEEQDAYIIGIDEPIKEFTGRVIAIIGDYMGKFLSEIKQNLCSNSLVWIKPIEDETDLWYAVEECKITSGQMEYVNPASFSVGRAYLDPENNVPCVIYNNENKRVGFISFRKIVLNKKGFNWSFYIDKNYQNKGLGRATAESAIKTLKNVDSNMPIFLTTEQNNELAQRLYINLGFRKADFLDGDDLVFIHE